MAFVSVRQAFDWSRRLLNSAQVDPVWMWVHIAKAAVAGARPCPFPQSPIFLIGSSG